MATYEKKKLSESSQGEAIWLNNMAPGGVIIHQTGTSSTVLDELWLWCKNSDLNNSYNVTIYLGESASNSPMFEQHNVITFEVPPNSIYSIFQGAIFSGSGASTFKIKGETPEAIGFTSVFGYVNRITP